MVADTAAPARAITPQERREVGIRRVIVVPSRCEWVVAAEDTITMSPLGRVRIDGRTSRLKWCGPMAWVPIRRATSVGSVSDTGNPRDAIPALHTRTSTNPKSASTAETMAAS